MKLNRAHVAILESMYLGATLISSQKAKRFRICPDFCARGGTLQGEHYGYNQTRVNTQTARALVRHGYIEASAVGPLSLVYAVTTKGRRAIIEHGVVADFEREWRKGEK